MIIMKRIDEALNDCIERMAAGESLDSCLSSYPDLSAELKPLLEMSSAVAQTAMDVEPSTQFKAEARYRFQEALTKRERKHAKPRSEFRRFSLKWATVAIALLVVFIAGSTTGIASAQSVPGQPMYPVKTFVERVQMGLTIGNARKSLLHITYAERRSSEMQSMINQGNLEQANLLGLKLSNHLVQATQAAPAVMNTENITGRLEQLANRQVAMLQVLLDKAPTDAQPAIQALINSINNAYENAINEIYGVLPSIQIKINDTILNGNTLTGTITLTNNSNLDATVRNIKYTLAYNIDSGTDKIWMSATILRVNSNLGGLEVGTVIKAHQSKTFNYSVNFSVPRSAGNNIRGLISIKLAGRDLWYYDTVEFNVPSLQSVTP